MVGGRSPAVLRQLLALTPLLGVRSGLGAVPFFLIPPEKLKGELVGAANAVAAGVTLAASFGASHALAGCSLPRLHPPGTRGGCGVARRVARWRDAVRGDVTPGALCGCFLRRHAV